MYIDNITSDSMTLTYNGKAMLIKVYEEEIERLKEQLNDEIDDELKQSEIMVKKQEEIERLNFIIKEVREYINKISSEPNVFGHYAIDGDCKKVLLKILDKEKE